MKPFMRTSALSLLIVPSILTLPASAKTVVYEEGFEAPPPKIARHFKPAGTNTVQLSTDAASGKQALRIHIEGYGIASDRIPLPSGAAGKRLLASFSVKGMGRIGVPIQYFGKAGRFLGGSGWNEDSTFFPAPFWRTFTLDTPKMTVPAGAETFTISFDRDRGYGDLLLDDLKVWLDDPAAPAKPVPLPELTYTNIAAGKVAGFSTNDAPPAGLVNLAPAAAWRSEPYTLHLERLADDDSRTFLTLREPSLQWDRVTWVEAAFPEPVEIQGFRLSGVPRWVRVAADPEGNGRFDTLLATDEPAYKIKPKNWGWFGCWGPAVWRDLPLAARRKVRGLRFYFPKGCLLREIQILTPSGRRARKMLAAARPAPAPRRPAALELGAAVTVPAPTADQRYLLGYTLEPWMFGSQGYFQRVAKGEAIPPLAEWPEWTNLIQREYVEMGANLIHLFPPYASGYGVPKGVKPQGQYSEPPVWPSQAFYCSQPIDLLSQMTADAHRHGLSVAVVTRDWSVKPGMSEAFVSEIASRGADLVAVAADEEYRIIYENPSMIDLSTPFREPARDGKDPAAWSNELAKARANYDRRIRGTRDFQARWPNTPPVGVLGDDEPSRKFILYFAERWGQSLKARSEAVRRANPKARSCVFVGGTQGTRIGLFSENENLGYEGGVDVMGCDPYYTREDPYGPLTPAFLCQMLRADTPAREAAATLNFCWANPRERGPSVEATYDRTCYVGGPLSCLFNGASLVNFWRCNFMDHMNVNGNPRNWIRGSFRMANALAAWGGKAARAPREIAFLRSRASEDFWQLHAAAHPAGGRPFDRDRGLMSARFAAQEMVFGGFAFETWFQERAARHEADIGAFRVILLAFPWSMDRPTHEFLRRAMAKGVKVVAVGAKGETDGVGTAWPKPLLEDDIAAGRVLFFPANVCRDGNAPATRKAFRELLETALGGAENRALRVDGHGAFLQASILEKSPEEAFVLLINWDFKDAAADLSLKMTRAGGRWAVDCLTPEGAFEMRREAGGASSLEASELAPFRIELPYPDGAVKILRIRRMGK